MSDFPQDKQANVGAVANEPRRRTIIVEIDMDEALPAHYQRGVRYGYDGEPEECYSEQPVTLTEAIINEAARQLVRVGEKKVAAHIDENLEDRINALIDAKLVPIIEAFFSTPVTTKSGAFDMVGTTKSVEQLIGERIESQIKQNPNAYGNEQTVLTKVIRDKVDAGLNQLFAEEVKQGTVAIREAMKKRAAEILTDSIAKAPRR